MTDKNEPQTYIIDKFKKSYSSIQEMIAEESRNFAQYAVIINRLLAEFETYDRIKSLDIKEYAIKIFSELDQLKVECEEWKNKYYSSTTEVKADLIKQLKQLKGEVYHKKEFIQEQRDIIDQLKAELKEFKDMAKQGLDNYKDVGGCWGCGISLVFDELLKSYKALELSSQKQLDQLKKNNEELERENKKLKSIIKQAIEDFNLEIGTPQYEILLNKSKELGVIKE